MIETEKHNDRIANMTFASVFPFYIKKVESIPGITVREEVEKLEKINPNKNK